MEDELEARTGPDQVANSTGVLVDSRKTLLNALLQYLSLSLFSPSFRRSLFPLSLSPLYPVLAGMPGRKTVLPRAESRYFAAARELYNKLDTIFQTDAMFFSSP